MSIKQFNKSSLGDISNIANPSKPQDGSVKRAGLFKVDIKGNIDFASAEGVFLLNPSSFEESKTANWVQHAVPGQSDPVFQWVSSGAKTLTFEALVTADTSDFNTEKTKVESKKAKPKNQIEAVADYAIKLFRVSIPPARTTEPAKNTEVLDITDQLNYYRSLLYPLYSDPSGKGVPQRLKASPPLLVLLAGNTVSNTKYGTRITNKHDVWVLADLRIRTTKMLPNLAPMEATVTFTLIQYNIRSFDSNKYYPSRG